MLRWLLASLVLLHGLIHLLGPASAFGWGQAKALDGRISRPLGWLWMLNSLIFVGVAVLLGLNHSAWWVWALFALLLSQALVFSAWSLAKAGTWVNALLLLPVLVAWGQARWQNQLTDAVTALNAEPPAAGLRYRPVGELPKAVRLWLRHCGALNQAPAQRVALRQQGRLRLAWDGGWMPFTAEEHFNAQAPGYAWSAEVSVLPVLSLYGRDQYRDGQGRVRVQALGWLPLSNAMGASVDQGSELRYLAEMAWFPSAALGSNVQWKAGPGASAEATLRDHGRDVSATFHFGPQGELLSVDALRYLDGPEGPALEPWHVEMDPASQRDFNGLRIPARSQVTWRLKKGDFHWLELELTGLSSGPAAPVARP
ncbi:MAG TPA: DUF6544 family protein [bacterium]|jgi:hypothetical protein|nr:DUF6544 family protein [bacterium]